jgi:D-aminoacyl-tRNA deacylase
MKDAALEGYDVSLEVTHHGPSSIGKPLVFIEIGSGEAQWNDKRAGKVVADAIRAIYENRNEFENYIGFGGIHYAPSFTNLLLENENVAIGHIAPKYASDFLDKEIIEQALKKGFAEKALFDWKGLKSEPRQKVISALDELGASWKRTAEMH